MVDVLVVGGGPTGLMLAAEASRRDLRVRVVDQLEGPSPLSRAIVVHARTLEILDGLGLAAPLVARGTPLRRVHLRSERRSLLTVGFDELPSPFPFLLSAPQSATEDVLARHLATFGVQVERPVRFAGHTEDADGVRVRLDGPGGPEEVRCRWLVGCDGAHSAVRHALGLPFDGHPYAERLALCDVRWDVDLPRDTLHSYLSADGFLAAFPLPQDRWRLIGVRRDDAPDEAALAELQAMVDSRTEAGGRLWDPTWVAGFRIHSRQVPRYRVGRVFLAGDAAHIHSPAGGQGMNLGLQDAHALAWRLAHRGPALEAVLDSYSAERHPVAAATLQGTELATWVGTARNVVARAARDAAAPWLASSSLVRDRVTRTLAELDTAVGGSPLVVGPGRRAPVAWGLGSPLGHVGVVGGGDVEGRACAAVLRAAGLPVVSRPEVTGAVVVRPDGYEGYAGRADPIAVQAWLERAGLVP